MIIFHVVDELGSVYRVVNITAGEISQIEKDGWYSDVEEDIIVGTDIKILKII